MGFAPSTKAGGKTRLASCIEKFKPHFIYDAFYFSVREVSKRVNGGYQSVPGRSRLYDRALLIWPDDWSCAAKRQSSFPLQPIQSLSQPEPGENNTTRNSTRNSTRTNTRTAMVAGAGTSTTTGMKRQSSEQNSKGKRKSKKSRKRKVVVTARARARAKNKELEIKYT